jgi:polyvinyl alcohol dehydrogenase (cytochrome)
MIAGISICLLTTYSYSQAGDDTDPGRAVYERACAACHSNDGNSRAPALESLRKFRRTTVEYAINIGYMKLQAKDLNPTERTQLLDWLAQGSKDNDAWLAQAMCQGELAAIDPKAKVSAQTWGLGSRNLRQQSAQETGLKTADFSNLELAWAFALPQTPSMRSQPVVAGNTIFVASADSGRLFALDTQSGCLKWQFEAEYPLRSSLTYGEMENKLPVIVMGDVVGAVLAVDAVNGKQHWRTDVRLHDANRITGAPVIHSGRVFAPLSGVEINHAQDDNYECCTAQGAVIALELKTGKQLWAGRTMEPATKRELNRVGAQLWGPSGAPIWSTPAIDAKRNRLYVGTGENNSLPVTGTSDAILAFDLDSGERLWSFQATRKDAWNYACRNGANCDWQGAAIIVDHDFGGSVMITQRSDGRDLLVVGQKSGTIWALDPDKNGELVWSTTIGSGGFNGGIHWGTATDGKRVFVPLNDRKSTEPDGEGRPGLFALDLDTGEVLWEHDAESDCSGDRQQRFSGCETRLGYSPAPLVVDGAVVQGSIDGILRVFDAVTGKMLWQYNTMRDFDTVNGVPGNGGSIDSSPYVAANGTLFVVSGYARFGETPGNVLLAFRPK